MSKGNTFFNNTAILMAIFPVYNILFSFFNPDIPLAGLIQASDVATATGMVQAAVVVAIIGSAFSVIVGIIGMKNNDNPDKMKLCILLAVVVMLIYAVSQVLDYVGGGVHDSLDYIGMIAGFAIPAGFIAGAVQVKAGE